MGKWVILMPFGNSNGFGGRRGDPTYLYNGESLTHWKDAITRLKAGETLLVNLNMVGTSLDEGYMSSDMDKLSTTAHLRNVAHAKFGPTGFGMIPVFYPYQGTPKWTLSAGWTDYGDAGIAGVSKQTSTAGQTATISFNGTGFRVLVYGGTASGTFTISVDGGTAVSCNAQQAVKNPCIAFEIKDLADGAHTFTLTTVSGNTRLIGGYELKGTKGIRVNMCGKASYTSLDLGAVNAIGAEVTYWQPTLTIIECYANDYRNSVSLSSYQTAIQAIITEAKKYGDVLIDTTGLRNETYTPAQTEYINILRSLAQSNNVALLDIAKALHDDPAYAVSKGLLADTVHYNDYGYLWRANLLIEALFGKI
jgi:hypothetical protein